MKPATWPEVVMPTPEEWRDWFLTNDRADQLSTAGKVLLQAEKAAACSQQDHDSMAEDLRAVHRRNRELVRTLIDAVAGFEARARRYRLAWMSARRFRRIYQLVGESPQPTEGNHS